MIRRVANNMYLILIAINALLGISYRPKFELQTPTDDLRQRFLLLTLDGANSPPSSDKNG